MHTHSHIFIIFTLTVSQHWPSSAFCMRIWVKVQRIPPRKDAISTMTKPSRLNWVDSNVNINRPPEISTTTRIRSGFWSKETEEMVRNSRSKELKWKEKSGIKKSWRRPGMENKIKDKKGGCAPQCHFKGALVDTKTSSAVYFLK